jgi:L-seryl-tRNA(Ser) seleniumtransferase
MVEVGYLGYPGAGGTMPWQLDEAITERTAAVACPILDTPGCLPLPLVCEIAHAKGVPVIVDAAAELPPRINLRRFIAEGADLVVFSGGKAIGGPQASGILAGRADLIASVALQHQDMDIRPETWSRRGWIAEGRVAGVPHQGFGRSMKVGREEIAGLLTALHRFAAGSDHEDIARFSTLLDPIEYALRDVPGISLERRQTEMEPVPRLVITPDPGHPAGSVFAIAVRLYEGDPRIAIGESQADRGVLFVNPMSLDPREAELVGRRLREVLSLAV